MISKRDIRNLLLEDLNEYLVLYEDTTSIFNVETEFINEYRFYSDEASSFINKNFSKEKDFIIYGLRNFDTYGNKIFISFEKGDYRTYLASKDKNYKKFIKEGNFFIVPITIASVITTKDNKILVLEEKNNYKLPSSIVCNEDINDSNINILNCIDRDLKLNNINIELYDSKIIGAYKSANSFIMILNQKTNEISKNIANAKFINNTITTLGDIVSSSDYLKRIRQAFKFYLKANFGNYTYINIKLK